MKVNILSNLRVIYKGDFIFYPWPSLELAKMDRSLMVNLGWLFIFISVVFDWEK